MKARTRSKRIRMKTTVPGGPTYGCSVPLKVSVSSGSRLFQVYRPMMSCE